MKSRVSVQNRKGRIRVNQQLEIRNIPNVQFMDSLQMSAFAFQYELDPVKVEKAMALLDSNQMWGAYVDDTLAAKMTILDLQTWIQGKAFDMGGIAGVVTWPEYRRGGLVAKLLLHGLRVMREKGQTVSFLHPFQFSFYRKYGWETYAEYKSYEISVQQLPRLGPQPGRIVRTGHDINLLNGIYEAYASRYNGTLIRNESWWRHRIFGNTQGTVAVYFDTEDQPAGYVYYQVKDNILKVHELVYLHHGACQALWRFLADHDSMLEKLVMKAPANDKLPFLLDNPRIKQEIVPYFMARIVDVAGFLTKYPFASGAEWSLQLEVKDEQAEWNNGWFLLQVDESGTARVEPILNASPELPAAGCTIQTLAAMLTGYQRPSFLMDIGRLTGTLEVCESLERLIPARQPYLPDFF